MGAFTINGPSLGTQSTVGQLYHFLSDFSNFGNILPEDKVEDFQSGPEYCSFSIKGITAMRIHLKDKQENTLLVFQSEGLSKFNFSLAVTFTGEAGKRGECSVQMSGNMNPFIFKMAERPLQQLVQSMTEKLSQLQVVNI